MGGHSFYGFVIGSFSNYILILSEKTTSLPEEKPNMGQHQYYGVECILWNFVACWSRKKK
jgi:hypothetical protein